MSDLDEELSLMSLSDDERTPAKPADEGSKAGMPRRESSEAKDLLDQATLWAEVDIDELERIAVNIAQNAVIQTENTEAVSRLNITASAIESDNMDPLGFGRIDTRVLALTHSDSAGTLGKGKSGGRASSVEVARRGSAGGRRSQSPGPEEGEVASTQLRNRVLPASEQFDPELYLRIIHADTPLQQLMTGLHNLKLQLSEHTGQMKALVKENFERFISSKNTIDDIYAKLQKAESEGEMGADGTSSSQVMAAVLQVQDEARRAFGSLLERQGKAERIKQVLGVIKRYEAVVRLPSVVREHAEAHDYDQVVAGYRKAKALLADHTSELPQQAQQDSMWLKLLEEIDKVVSGAAVTLETLLRSPGSGAGEALEAIKSLLQLQAVGCKAAQGINPVRLYIESQERAVMGAIEGQQQRYSDRMGALQRQRQETEEREAQLATLASMGITPPPSAAAAPAGAATAATDLGKASQQATARHVARLAAALEQWLPSFWTLTQARLPGLASIGDSAPSIEAGMAEAEAAVGRVMTAFRQAVREAVGSPQGLDAAGHLSVVRDLAACCLAVQQAAPTEGPAPVAAVEALQGLVEQAAKQCLVQLRLELETAVGRLCAAEEWALDPASQRAGTPVTGTMAALGRLVGGGMQVLQLALQEAAKVQVNPLRKSAAPARDAFFACFAALGAGLQKLAATAGEEAPSSSKPAAAGTGSAPTPPPPGRRLLLLCANAIGARTQLLPSLYRTWAGVLLAGGPAREGQAAAAGCAEELEKVEGALVLAYIDRKQAVLDEVMEEFFFGGGTAWEVAPPPIAPRPVVLELIHALVQVQAELASTAPSVLVEVVAELVTSLVEGFCEVVGGEGGLSPGISPGGVCQLWLEARYLAAAVGGLSWQALGDALRALDGTLAQRLQHALAAVRPGSNAAVQLAAWCGAGGGPGARGAAAGGDGLVQACAAKVRALSEGEAAATATNLLPLQLLWASAAQKA